MAAIKAQVTITETISAPVDLTLRVKIAAWSCVIAAGNVVGISALPVVFGGIGYLNNNRGTGSIDSTVVEHYRYFNLKNKLPTNVASGIDECQPQLIRESVIIIPNKMALLGSIGASIPLSYFLNKYKRGLGFLAPMAFLMAGGFDFHIWNRHINIVPVENYEDVKCTVIRPANFPKNVIVST